MALVEFAPMADMPVAHLVLNRPEARNALNGPLLDALDNALDRVEQDENIRALILTGMGGYFSAGADLKEQHADPMERVRRMHGLVLRLRDLRVISIAAIDGLALGGGLELAMSCTFRVAAPGARLGLPEMRMNWIPGFGGTQLLPRLVGPVAALDMLLSGEPVLAEAALGMGLVNRVAGGGDVLGCARELARRYIAHDPRVQQAARRAVWDGITLSLEDALAVELEQVHQVTGAARRT